jgi:hypothetical protein
LWLSVRILVLLTLILNCHSLAHTSASIFSQEIFVLKRNLMMNF